MIIETKLGPIDEALLEKKISERQTPSGVMRATEYRKDGELVRRDAVFSPGEKLSQEPLQ